jgi:hypothetical protein
MNTKTNGTLIYAETSQIDLFDSILIRIRDNHDHEPTRGQFHQNFMSSFCADFVESKKYKPKNVSKKSHAQKQRVKCG